MRGKSTTKIRREGQVTRHDSDATRAPRSKDYEYGDDDDDDDHDDGDDDDDDATTTTATATE